MQDQNCVFKVPRTKKRWPNLYCRETLSDLDEVWGLPKETPVDNSVLAITETESHTHARRSLKLEVTGEKSINVVHNESNNAQRHNNIAVTSMNDEKLLLSESVFSHISDEEKYFDKPQDKYTIGLLEEFNMTPFHLPSSDIATTSLLPRNDPKCIGDNGGGADARLTQHCEGIFHSLQCAEESVHEVPDASNVEAASYLSPEGQDILIVRDESMANADSESSGSDIDWESLTPPVPRSPSDHKVPDFATPASPGTFVLHSCDHLSAYSDTEGMLNENDNEHFTVSPSLFQLFSHSSLDHVVPDFYV